MLFKFPHCNMRLEQNVAANNQYVILSITILQNPPNKQKPAKVAFQNTDKHSHTLDWRK